jgi:arabinose-5-phosphate isomerase
MMWNIDKNLDRIVRAAKSVNVTDFERLCEDCIKIIDDGGKIITSGLGKNVPVCEKFSGTLNSLGIPAAFLHTNTAVHGDLGIVCKKDLVIILTKSGETVESVYLVDLLKKRGCKLWLLTFKENSTLSSKIHDKLVIDLEHEGDMWNIVPNNSTVLNLIILQELAMQMSKKRKIQLEEFMANHPGGDIGKRLIGDVYE